MRFHADNRRYAKYAAICAGAGLLGVLIGRATWWVGGPIAVFFFALTLVLVYRTVSGPAQFTVDEDGLGGARLPRSFAWSEIAALEHTTRPARYGTLQFLRITVRDDDDVELSLTGLLTPPAAIIAEVERFHEVA